ncbi:2-keto-4-pentenoate hydratase [Burkholderia sp. K24]|jgi:2-keto-4-pentenoate hydratase|uniref:2-keto-4-pentenoate hydratase n=1 Tax=Paraburkholderia fungorum TaxID=134537 RepID=UPI00054F9C5A|nr:2-keto-4-pentenoate hydratase [Paraburkholderia fungorum]ALE55148.1 2-keto-4-pentenoate hydratase [Burkholderia sp. HB1]KFX63998.1 2-keto-4-pentenoate hydratase [Burkholderia sp. K24]MBU7436278.1 2-keto-4-pentenoate hydratase [Paraburkholderia fungorum]
MSDATIEHAGVGTASIEQLARELRDCYGTGQTIAPLRTRLPIADIDTAYAIQDFNTEAFLAQGRRLVGRKIGLTSKVVQKQLGVDRPDFGMLFADMAIGEGDPIPVSRVHQPKIEAEVALVLSRDIDTESPTVADLLLATAYVVPALEIVGSRIAQWDIGILDTVADNASSGLFVLGGPARRLDGLDLRNLQMTLRREPDSVTTGSGVVSTGCGAACLGHPLNAAVWLAGEVARRGRPLMAGDVILTGALGPMVPVTAGDTFVAQLSGLGEVTARFV